MNTPRVVAIDRDAVASMLDHMAALADPIRCRMLLPLERHELTVSELCAVLQLPQSTVSRHLKTLATTGGCASRRDGTSRYYDGARRGSMPARAALAADSRAGGARPTGADQDERRLKSVLGAAALEVARSSSRRRRGSGIACARSCSATFHLQALLRCSTDADVVGDLGCGTGQIERARWRRTSRA